MMFVTERFKLCEKVQDYLRSLVPPFGYNGFGEAVYYRTYSRKIKEEGVEVGQEAWADTVIRAVQGTFSIRKDFYIKNRIPWDDYKWQEYAKDFAIYLFKMKWMPPGRGLWAMGSDFVYERGSMALYNCAFTILGDASTFADDVGWLMDSLMNGVGVGFAPDEVDLKLVQPHDHTEPHWIIPDSREGWVESVTMIIDSFILGDTIPKYDYSLIRPAGLPINGFGGISSGPEPLNLLHISVEKQCYQYLKGEISEVEFKTNVANLVGCCVVAGNVRRSAEIAIRPVTDQVFLDLKNYEKHPHRAAYGWMSNNSAIFFDDDDFDKLGEIADRVIRNGEPGVVNLRNFKHGRIGKNDGLREDRAIGLNPCGEIPLENREVCNLAETFPTMCDNVDEWYKACEYAAFYCSTVSLLPTHQSSTNRIVARNRRIGVGLVDYSGWVHREGVHKVTRYLRNGYDVVRETNRNCNSEAGVPEAIRVTTVKPGGTTPKLPGKTSGCGRPTFRHTIRRIRVQQGTQYHELLVKAGVPWEKDYYSANTDVFEWPIIQGPADPAEMCSIWEQAFTIIMLQREWSDNAVSNTIYFRPKWRLTAHYKVFDGDDVVSELASLIGRNTLLALGNKRQREYEVHNNIKCVISYNDGFITEAKVYEYDPAHEEDFIEPVLSYTVPHAKSLSLLPHTPAGVYKQMPEEGISVEEYELRVSQIKPIDWSELFGSDGEDERYCEGPTCAVTIKS